MNSIIEIENLSYNYGTKKVLDSFSLTVNRGIFLTILGESGSGKSTLVKVLSSASYKTGNIFINQILLTKETRKEIHLLLGIVSENADATLIGETAIDNITFVLENRKYDNDIILDAVKEIVQLLHIESLLDKKTDELSGGEKELVTLASVLVAKPRILVLDEALKELDVKKKEKVFYILRNLQKKSGITILNFTQDVEQSIFGDEIVLMKDGKVLKQGSKEELFEDEKLFKEASLELPFMASLSKKLGYYGMMNGVIYQMDEMVDALWK